MEMGKTKGRLLLWVQCGLAAGRRDRVAMAGVALTCLLQEGTATRGPTCRSSGEGKRRKGKRQAE